MTAWVVAIIVGALSLIREGVRWHAKRYVATKRLEGIKIIDAEHLRAELWQAMRAEIDELRKKDEEQEDEMRVLRRKDEDQQSEIATLRHQLEASTRDRELLKNENRSLLSKVSALQNEKAKLENRVSELERKNDIKTA